MSQTQARLLFSNPRHQSSDHKLQVLDFSLAHSSSETSVFDRPQISEPRPQNSDLRIISRCIPIAHRPQSNEANKNKSNESKLVSCNLCSRVDTLLGRRMQPSGVGLHRPPGLPRVYVCVYAQRISTRAHAHPPRIGVWT